jgi:hypothetical protein
MIILHLTVNCVTLRLLYVDRNGEITEEIAVAMNRGGHDVGLRKQHLGYHNIWDCWYFTFLVWFWVLHSVDVRCVY